MIWSPETQVPWCLSNHLGTYSQPGTPSLHYTEILSLIITHTANCTVSVFTESNEQTPSAMPQRGFSWTCLLYDNMSLRIIYMLWHMFTEPVDSKWTTVQYYFLKNFTCHLLVNSASTSLSYLLQSITWVHWQLLLGLKNYYSVDLYDMFVSGHLK